MAVIPPEKSRLVQREYDRPLYRERNSVECFTDKVKQYRRAFSRFARLWKDYPGLLSFVSAHDIWLR